MNNLQWSVNFNVSRPASASRTLSETHKRENVYWPKIALVSIWTDISFNPRCTVRKAIFILGFNISEQCFENEIFMAADGFIRRCEYKCNGAKKCRFIRDYYNNCLCQANFFRDLKTLQCVTKEECINRGYWNFCGLYLVAVLINNNRLQVMGKSLLIRSILFERPSSNIWFGSTGWTPQYCFFITQFHTFYLNQGRDNSFADWYFVVRKAFRYKL